jgi:hypothetical protein
MPVCRKAEERERRVLKDPFIVLPIAVAVILKRSETEGRYRVTPAINEFSKLDHLTKRFWSMPASLFGEDGRADMDRSLVHATGSL